MQRLLIKEKQSLHTMAYNVYRLLCSADNVSTLWVFIRSLLCPYMEISICLCPIYVHIWRSWYLSIWRSRYLSACSPFMSIYGDLSIYLYACLGLDNKLHIWAWLHWELLIWLQMSQSDVRSMRLYNTVIFRHGCIGMCQSDVRGLPDIIKGNVCMSLSQAVTS